MTFPLDPLNAALDRLSRHPFYSDKLPNNVADAADFANAVPLMSRPDLVAEMHKARIRRFWRHQSSTDEYEPDGRRSCARDADQTGP